MRTQSVSAVITTGLSETHSTPEASPQKASLLPGDLRETIQVLGPSPMSSLLRASTARFLSAPEAAFTTRSCSLVRRSAMAESAFSCRKAERMYRPY